MISFESDYNNGAHPSVLRHLVETNDEKTASYGADRFSESAREKIRKACGCPDADIYFLAGGTQTNATVISTMLQPYEGVVSVPTGHIAVHEAGAVEYTGHKVLEIEGRDGKMDASVLDAALNRMEGDPSVEHIVYPGMVYITFPTELGTIYKAAELEAIYKVCQAHSLPLFVDGARLGYGLNAIGGDIDLKYLAAHCDCFYIGGTKVGALCGEAVVFPRNNAPKHFFTMVKQHGALLAKSRVAGVQFDALFTDGLYLEISRHAIAMAKTLIGIFEDAGYKMAIDSPTNQQFVVLDRTLVERLWADGILFEIWEPLPENRALCRFVTSWATTTSELDALRSAIVHR